MRREAKVLERLLDSQTGGHPAREGDEDNTDKNPTLSPIQGEGHTSPVFTFPNEVITVDHSLAPAPPAHTPTPTQIQSHSPIHTEPDDKAHSKEPSKEDNVAETNVSKRPAAASRGQGSALASASYSALRNQSRITQAILKQVEVSPGRLPRAPAKTRPQAITSSGTGAETRKAKATTTKAVPRVPPKHN